MNDVLLYSLYQAFPAITGNNRSTTNLKVGNITDDVFLTFFGMLGPIFLKKSQNNQQQVPKQVPKQVPRTKQALPRLAVQFPKIPYNCSLSVVLPAYNEEATIQRIIQETAQTLLALVSDFEILVINDGSKDQTAEKVKQLIPACPQLRLIQHTVNLGCGAALITGFTNATKEYTFYMDSDGQFDIRELVHFLPLLQHYDGVFGFRQHRQDHWGRQLNGWCWNQIIRFMFNIHIKDIDCAYKIFRTEYFQRVTLDARGPLLLTEAVYKFLHAGYNYTQVGVSHYPRQGGRSTGAKPTVILRAFYELFVYAQKWHRQEFKEYEQAQKLEDLAKQEVHNVRL